MYSEQLKKEKICSGNAGIKTAIMGVDFEEKDVCMMIDCFCQKEDVLGVPTKKLFELFDDFCEKCGYLKISHLTLGRIFREHFNLKRKRVRKGKKLYWVYVSADKPPPFYGTSGADICNLLLMKMELEHL